MDNVLTWHVFVALCCGGILLGYLMTEWYYQRFIEEQGKEIDELAEQVEILVAENDGYDKLVTELKANIQFMDDANGKLLNKLNQLEVKSGQARSW